MYAKTSSLMLKGIYATMCFMCNLPLKLTLTVLVATIDAQWEGMGDVGSARY